MITKLIIKSQSDSFSINTGTIVLVSDSSVIIQADSNAVHLSLGNFLPDISDSQSGIKTINLLPAASWDNNFYILGSGCTSIITPKITSDSLLIWSDSISGVIGIFDGCVPCQNCDTIAQLQRNLELCQIWINGLKDCNLYYEDTAAQLWDNMKTKVVQQDAACGVSFSDLILDRKQSLRRATKLLYQYKALVALWNYLVRTKQGFMHILTAPLDWAGFIVGSKRVVTNCGLNASDNRAVTLTIRLTLQDGQNITYLKSRTIDSKATPQNLYYYVGKAPLNTYILYGGDTGRGVVSRSDSILFSDSLWYTSDSGVSDQVVITARFTFIIKRGDNTTLSGAIKILPCLLFRRDSSVPIVALLLDISNSLSKVSALKQWSKLRGGSKQLLNGSDIDKNYWCIESWWDFDSLISDSKMFYLERIFLTPYSKLGLSDSI